MKNIAVLWDIQNVLPSKETAAIFVDGLLSYCESIGNRSYLIAVGDWKKNIAENIPSILSENGFELLYIPQLDDKGKKTKDSVDFILITKATEMIFQYPHIDTYVILTGDVDFRPLVQLLKKHGKIVNIIYNPNNVSERLLEFADDYKDYRDLIPDETDQYPQDDEDTKNTKEFTKEEAFNLLIESINQMKKNKKVPTPGSVKVRMKMINDNFTGMIPGISNWLDFINEANSKGLISYEQKKKDLILSVKNIKTKPEKDIFSIFINIMKTISPDEKWITFTKINQTMIDKNIRIKNYNYTKFKKLAIEADKRSLITIKSDGLRWMAKIKKTC
ncbi:MAG: hypothetical protein DRH93_10585 [Deltaproteobacteria bacterium]|nr:MAG: hypothetical protein DRH93_10585 [Deltaproteobacteria bacterium]